MLGVVLENRTGCELLVLRPVSDGGTKSSPTVRPPEVNVAGQGHDADERADPSAQLLQRLGSSADRRIRVGVPVRDVGVHVVVRRGELRLVVALGRSVGDRVVVVADERRRSELRHE